MRHNFPWVELPRSAVLHREAHGVKECVGLSGWQSGFREALSNPLDVPFPLERLPADVFGE
jgi:hypothetical protein